MIAGRCPDTPTPPAPTPARLLRINEVAAEIGLTTRTIRYYEEVGLLAPAARSDGDYRLYDASDLDRLRFIRDLRDDAGFSLAQIRQLLEDEAARERNRARLRATTDPVERRRVPPRGGGADPAPGRIARCQGGTAGDHDRRGAGPAGSRPRPPGRPGGRPRRDGRRDAPMNGTGTKAGLHAIAGETRDRYRWIVLGVTSVGALLAALTSGTLVIALPHDPARPPHGPVQPDVDRRRLHAGGDRPRPERRADRGPGRARAFIHGRVRPVHDRLGRVRPGPERRAAHRGPADPGHRRRVPDGQLGGIGDRRVPAPGARPRARDQRHGRRGRA